MLKPPGVLIQEADFNAGQGGPMEFCGFLGDPAFEDLRHGSRYIARTRDRIFSAAAARGRTFVEVGAHIGGTTLHAAKVFGRIIAYEPSSRNLECLRYNLAANKITNVEARQAAVSDYCGKARFFLYPDGNACGHSLTEAIVRGGAPHEPVRVTTLAADLPDVDDCGMLLVDAEGHDLKVLLGAGPFLERQKARPLIQIEWAPQMLMRTGCGAELIRDWCVNADYSPYIDAGNNLAPVSDEVLVDLFDLWANRCAGWLDVYLVPTGELADLFPRVR
jgi:FkbM family methyltransferase